MKVYHLVILVGLISLLAPKLGAGVVVATALLAIVLWALAAALGFPGWKSKPRQ